MRRSGDTVIINGNEYVLGKRIGGGKEGDVFEIENKPKFLIKLLKSQHLNQNEKDEIKNRLKWIGSTIDKSEALKGHIAYPRIILDDDCGYIMGYANDHDSLKSFLDYPGEIDDFQKWINHEYNYKKRLQICSMLFKLLEEIHISGLIFSDLSPNNVMIHRKQNNIVFIDTDNMRRKSDVVVNVMGTEGYLAPELCYFLNQDNAIQNEENQSVSIRGRISTDSDIFSAAIIAFQLLTLGHPYYGDSQYYGTADDELSALHCKTDYVFKTSGENPLTGEVNPFAPLFHDYDNPEKLSGLWTKKIKDLFYQTFVHGKENIIARPTALEFYEAFMEAIDMLTECEFCKVEGHLTHLVYHSGHENICWNCNKKIEERFILETFCEFCEKKGENFAVSKMSKVVSDLLDVEINDENPADDKKARYSISKIVLSSDDYSYMYLRHLDKNHKRQFCFTKLILENTNENFATIYYVPNQFVQNSYVLSKDGKREPVRKEKGTYFFFEKEILIFELVDYKNGKIVIKAKISKG